MAAFMMVNGVLTEDMDTVRLNGQVVAFILENSKTIVATVKEKLLTLMAPSIKENGKMIREMARVLLPGLMGLNTWGYSEMI